MEGSGQIQNDGKKQRQGGGKRNRSQQAELSGWARGLGRSQAPRSLVFAGPWTCADLSDDSLLWQLFACP